MFIERGADLEGVVRGFQYNDELYREDKALLVASRGGHLKIVKLRLDCGADVNGDEGSEYSGLCWAAANGHTEIVKLLLLSGASLFSSGDQFVLEEAKELSSLPIKRDIEQMFEDAATTDEDATDEDA